MPIKDLPNLKNTNLCNIIDAPTKNRSENKIFSLFGSKKHEIIDQLTSKNLNL